MRVIALWRIITIVLDILIHSSSVSAPPNDSSPYWVPFFPSFMVG
uniref:ORF44d n=1 Tax=Pinus thunbergii TaxID=3350 RepID=Q32998_PINTH|nr:ORF44d [Pinus thunbergii]